jgi:hypothetical protein
LYEPWKIVEPQNVRHKLLERDMTRCVDPTQAMKATFASASIGSCHSSRPEKVSNKYIFSDRCDYMGPVNTIITCKAMKLILKSMSLRSASFFVRI